MQRAVCLLLLLLCAVCARASFFLINGKSSGSPTPVWYTQDEMSIVVGVPYNSTWIVTAWDYNHDQGYEMFSFVCPTISAGGCNSTQEVLNSGWFGSSLFYIYVCDQYNSSRCYDSFNFQMYYRFSINYCSVSPNVISFQNDDVPDIQPYYQTTTDETDPDYDSINVLISWCTQTTVYQCTNKETISLQVTPTGYLSVFNLQQSDVSLGSAANYSVLITYTPLQPSPTFGPAYTNNSCTIPVTISSFGGTSGSSSDATNSRQTSAIMSLVSVSFVLLLVAIYGHLGALKMEAQ